MANENFLQLPTVTSAQLSDVVAAVQSNVTVQETLQQIFNLFLANNVLSFAGNPNGNVAGTAFQFCYDTTNKILYICTTTGSASTAVWTATSIGSFPVSLSNGGTSASLVASNGGVVYSGAAALAILAAGATGQILQTNGAAPPSWSIATYPSTAAINTLLYASAANVISALATANSSALATTSTGVPTWLGPMTNGQVMIGSTGALPVMANLTGTNGISVTPGPGTITISYTGSSPAGWTEVTGTSQTMVADGGYIANNAGLVTLTLPATATQGTSINVIGKGAGGWKIAQTAGQNIQIGSSASTVGVGGSVASSNQFDSVCLICTTANTVWTSFGGPQGNLVIV